MRTIILNGLIINEGREFVGNIIIDNNMVDPRGWDLSFIAQIHDNSWGELCRYDD